MSPTMMAAILRFIERPPFRGGGHLTVDGNLVQLTEGTVRANSFKILP